MNVVNIRLLKMAVYSHFKLMRSILSSTYIIQHLKVVTTPWRYCSDNNDADVFIGPIPRDKLSITYSRSSGPGGQNVNKLNTKAEIRFHVESADWIVPQVKERLQKLCKNRINKSGEFIISSQYYRSQHQNLEDAIKRLHTLLVEASQVPHGPSELTRARIQLLKRKAERRRLIEKKYHSSIKRERKKTDI